MPERVYIIDAKRTGFAPSNGALSHLRSESILAQLGQGLLTEANLDPVRLRDWIVGCSVQQGEQALNIARQASLLLGWENVPGLTINRMETSGLESILWGQRSCAEEGGFLLAGGCEKMTVSGLGAAKRTPHPDMIKKSPQSTEPALLSAQRLVKAKSIDRKALDLWVLESHRRAVKAQDEDLLHAEILALCWQEKIWKESGWVEIASSLSSDECPREDLSLEQLASLAPAMGSGSILTGAHLAPPCDGAALCLMASENEIKALQMKPMAQLIASSVEAKEPWLRGMDLCKTANVALQKVGLKASDMDVVQVSEATASTAYNFSLDWEGSQNKINIHGGTLAYGNAMAASGASMLVSLIHELRRCGGRYGLIAQDATGGHHMAVVVEVL